MGVWLAPVEMDTHARGAMAIAVGMALCWMLDVFHPALVGFIGCFLFVATGEVEFETAFSGFATETPWFLYGALLLMDGARRAGLNERIGTVSPGVTSRRWLVAAAVLVALAYALSWIVPSGLARAVILALFARAWWPAPSGASTSAGGTALVLLAAYAGTVFGHPDLAGGAVGARGWDLGVAVALLAAGSWWARDSVDTGHAGRAAAIERDRPFRPVLAAPVLVAVGLWLTTPVHGWPPALVGLTCGLVCLLPGVSTATRDAGQVDHLAIVFLGTALSLPEVLIETGAAGAAQQWLGAILGGSRGGGYVGAVAYRLLSPESAQPALPSLAGPLASTALWSYAGATLLSLHQAPALVFAWSVAGVRSKHVLTVGLLVLVVGAGVVTIF